MKLKTITILLFLSTHLACGQSVQQSISAGREFLLKQISPAGNIYDEISDKSNTEHGLATLMTINALLKTEPASITDELQRAIDWATQQDFMGVAPHAMRIIAFRSLRGKIPSQLIAKDTEWLVNAASNNGGWGWCTKDKKTNNLATAWAVQALFIANKRGVPIKSNIWQKAIAYWRNQQNSSGGWAFTKFRGNSKRQANPYGSMTAHAILSLWECYLGLSRNEGVNRNAIQPVNASIHNGWRWLDNHFELANNPQKGREWYFDYLAALSELGEKMGYRQFDGKLFGPLVTQQIISMQNSDGSWGFAANKIESTSNALIALTAAEGKMFIGKLQFPGKWNLRPADMRNLISWLDKTYELELQWQVLDLQNGKKGYFTKAGKLLYISGSGRFDFNDADTVKLRDFVNRGGMIITDAIDNDGDFTLSIRRLFQKISPNTPVEILPETSPLLNLQFKVPKAGKIHTLKNGERITAIHLPWDISKTLELHNTIGGRKTYEMLANVFLYLTKKGRAPVALLPAPPEKLANMTKQHVEVARIKFDGDYNPEPYGLRYFNNYMIKKHSTRLFIDDFIEIGKLNAKLISIAYLAGTGKFPELSMKELLAMQKYLVDGGTLIVEAVGGSKIFAETVQKNLLNAIGKIRPYKQENSKIKAIYMDKRPTVIFSPIDFQESLIDATYWGLSGFGKDARKILGAIFMDILSDK